jgi:hypothetical protein
LLNALDGEDLDAIADGFETQAQLLADGGEERWSGGFGPGQVRSPFEGEVIGSGKPSAIDDGAIGMTAE